MGRLPSSTALLERLKRTVLVWLAVYPTVLAVLLLLGDALRGWPLPLRVLGSTALIVPIVTNIAEPLVKRTLSMLTSRIPKKHRLR
ncbi:MAG: hypothetical protein ACN6NZ_00020 [Burkholderiales bacterium]|nr:hypothetical protein SRABI35_01257 [Stenotrophomonas lactitubi]